MSFVKSDIVLAVRDSRFIKDPFFSGLTANILPSGRPEMYSGGFSQVFPIKKGDKKWAFKIWHEEISDNKIRHEKVKNHLTKCNLPYFVEFDFVEKGLLISNGEFLDTLRMEWVEDLTLKQYIATNLRNQDKLEKLAEDFLKMVIALENNSISHGDLHHENILIHPDSGEIKLIDYDSICIPELEGTSDICRGRYPYQHPARMMVPMVSSVKTDRFSQLIIYICIVALIENPLLWDKHNVDEAEERLLFAPRDIYNWEDSELRPDLYLLSHKVVSLIKIYESYLAAHLLLPPFIR